MVLWEITLGTAYFLGLKRTYRLALRIQRKLISPNHPKVRDFLHRRTRAVFDVVVKVHRNIQDRDIEAGRNLGNTILRWLDRMKPSAGIRGPPSGSLPSGSSSEKLTKNSAGASNNKPTGYFGSFKKDSDRHLFTSLRQRPFPTISMMTRPPNPARTSVHGRNLSIYAPEISSSNYRMNESGGVFRKDIMQWMLRN
ncbi:uncharacterized protein [Arachis hypogaea]|uniref:Uncharacterized protein n=1 Tax=Arachis hypogaea TaxID=3818 RepID=A0A444WVL0_ARAHY|nr:uncharacterized protein LOC112747435 [Arachis hypogaea]XP_025697879.1 uncharacterized protein LOC112800047 [Arachis hypogaea]QHO44497.1 uncharacterized protein DS421_5g171540 [Arachis hypogaea]RYQ81497.1 hypothetical protein Ahy_Scaffold1g107409 [Arachis hypogaea]